MTKEQNAIYLNRHELKVRNNACMSFWNKHSEVIVLYIKTGIIADKESVSIIKRWNDLYSFYMESVNKNKDVNNADKNKEANNLKIVA